MKFRFPGQTDGAILRERTLRENKDPRAAASQGNGGGEFPPKDVICLTNFPTFDRAARGIPWKNGARERGIDAGVSTTAGRVAAE